MCIKCAIGMSNETVKEQLENGLERKNFDKINTTGVQFILYACIGIFGNESKKIGLELIKMFIEWLKTKEHPYVPQNGFEEMYHYRVLMDLTEWCESSDFLINDDCESESENKRIELFNLLARKMNEFNH